MPLSSGFADCLWSFLVRPVVLDVKVTNTQLLCSLCFHAAAPTGNTGPVRTAMLETPNVPAPRMTSGPYPHVLTGLNLMTTRLENEYDDAELDPLPRIREYYGELGGPWGPLRSLKCE